MRQAMESPADRITEELVLKNLQTAVVGKTLHCFESIDSTNRRARHLAGGGAPDGTVVVAEYQTRGRGRLSRSWEAPPHSCILCSVIFRAAMQPEFLFRLTMMASIAAVDALQMTAGIRFGIKWPNDVYAGDKKICGILTETECSAQGGQYAIVGMGINVNWKLKEHKELGDSATSLSDLCGRDISRAGLLQELLHRLDGLYSSIHDGPGLHRQWMQRCMHLGRLVSIVSDRDTLEGSARGITESGHLLLESADGRMHEILCGDVSLRL
jgi:BirA family transcriptional regulator, biotin operon repressor / biotin---[acetyl-CoA-carboxylase] ligase